MRISLSSTSLVCLTLASGTALGADLPSRNGSQPYTAAVPVFVWTGPYVGVNTGYSIGTADYTYSVHPEGNPLVMGKESVGAEGVIGGGQIGYNFALGPAVIGGEADFDGTTIKSSGLVKGLLASTMNTVYGNSATNYVGTARGRLGYAFGRLLLYATGGFAYANVSSSADAINIRLSAGGSHIHTGYAVGGGVEYAIANNVSLRAEYLRLDCNSRTFIYNGDENLSYQLQHKPIYNLARVGINYNFGLFAAAPVVARY